jgi:imidazole glycerol-phosphate synthase subunit HisH
MNKPLVMIVDYGMGNIWSVISAIKYLGGDAELVSDPEILAKSDILILPGVGSFRRGMQVLEERGIDKAIHSAVLERGAKILGICLGMQLLGSHSTEGGETPGLGLVSNRVESFTYQELGNNKVPHVGFNSVRFSEREGLFRELPETLDFYFTHSYRMLVDDIKGRYATCSYGIDFLAAFEEGNICGAQFHPEKSQTNGLILLRNFLEI